MNYDTLVIGAGAAGLAAARHLHDAGQTVLVIEARDRIGGRIWTDHTFADFPIELGAELIHGETAVTHELLRAADFQALPAPRKPLLRWGGPTGAKPLADLPEELRHTLEALQAAYNQLPTQANLATDEALADYLYRHGFSPTAIEMADVLLAQTCCAPITTLSCADLVREMMADHAGAAEFRIAEGYGPLLAAYSSELPIQLSTVVRTIRRNDKGVAVVTDRGIFYARRVLVTIPVSVLQAGGITFDPPLSASKQAAIAAFRTEAATKLFYRFSEPLWDEQLAYMMHTGLAARWWTSGYPRPGAAVLCCYVTAKRAQQIDAMAEAAALKVGLDELAGLLGRRDVHEKCIGATRIAWAADPYALGGYAHIPPGAAAARPILAQPEGDRLFFAGEATAYDTNPQTVHGAIESGWRAAREILR
jgi:monoamine oxidase